MGILWGIVLWIKLDKLGIHWCMLSALKYIVYLVYISSILRNIERTLGYIGSTVRVYWEPLGEFLKYFGLFSICWEYFRVYWEYFELCWVCWDHTGVCWNPFRFYCICEYCGEYYKYFWVFCEYFKVFWNFFGVFWEYLGVLWGILRVLKVWNCINYNLVVCTV